MSSDSEDDCYGNAAKKLQSIQNEYREDMFETSTLLKKPVQQTSFDIKDSKTRRKKAETPKSPNQPANDSTDFTDDSIIDKLIAEHTTERTTRSRGRKKANEGNFAKSSVKKTAVRKGKGRGKGRKTANSTISGLVNSLFPTYSVGNTDEYPDQCDEQELFTKKQTDIVIEEDALEENEEISVKVHWQSSEYFKFNIRKFQKLSQIFDYFSNKENVGNDKLLFMYNEKILKPEDTPDSIDYSIAKFIDGGIVSQNVTNFVKSKTEHIRNGMKIKFQCQHLKKPFEIMIKPVDKLQVAMIKCAEHLEKPLDKLKFTFDGDVVAGNMTAQEMDLEAGECIDVNILS